MAPLNRECTPVYYTRVGYSILVCRSIADPFVDGREDGSRAPAVPLYTLYFVLYTLCFRREPSTGHPLERQPRASGPGLLDTFMLDTFTLDTFMPCTKASASPASAFVPQEPLVTAILPALVKNSYVKGIKVEPCPGGHQLSLLCLLAACNKVCTTSVWPNSPAKAIALPARHPKTFLAQ